MRVVLILVRILVLLTALAGAAWVGINGSLLYAAVAFNDNPPADSHAEPLKPDERETLVKTIPFLAAGAVMALIGGILAACGYTANGGVWLLVGAVGPILLFQGALCINVGLIAAAGLSVLVWFVGLFVKPRPEAATA